jgi:hypothetical protein
VSVRRTRIFRNLHYRWTFAGFGLDDLAIAGVPTFGAMLVFPGLGLSQIWSAVVLLSILAVLFIVKRGKPDGYLEGLLTSLLMPKHYSHKERERFVRPFHLSPAQCSPSTAATKETVSNETVRHP